jgi:Helix-turn-helix domain
VQHHKRAPSTRLGAPDWSRLGDAERQRLTGQFKKLYEAGCSITELTNSTEPGWNRHVVHDVLVTAGVTIRHRGKHQRGRVKL